MYARTDVQMYLKMYKQANRNSPCVLYTIVRDIVPFATAARNGRNAGFAGFAVLGLVVPRDLQLVSCLSGVFLPRNKVVKQILTD